MRKAILVLVSASLLAGPAFAQQDRTPRGAPPKTERTDAAPTPEMCRALMSRHMEGRPPNGHGHERMGPMTWPDGKPLTAAEMERMHRDCAAKMHNPASPPPPR